MLCGFSYTALCFVFRAGFSMLCVPCCIVWIDFIVFLCVFYVSSVDACHSRHMPSSVVSPSARSLLVKVAAATVACYVRR